MTAVPKRIVPAPVRKTLHVKAAPEHAFKVFTAGMGRWWPKSHHIGKVELKDVTIEPRAGGRWYEKGEDGSECQWGYVIAWEPPRRLVLAWQLSAEWQFDASLVTEVEVAFIPDGTGTRVEFEHRNLERFGDKAAAVRDAISSPGGWPGILDEFAKVVGE
jgi:uncharacterized protein YndB with AHSA1/START domain